MKINTFNLTISYLYNFFPKVTIIFAIQSDIVGIFFHVFLFFKVNILHTLNYLKIFNNIWYLDKNNFDKWCLCQFFLLLIETKKGYCEHKKLESNKSYKNEN
jgi:hypothetical protein